MNILNEKKIYCIFYLNWNYTDLSKPGSSSIFSKIIVGHVSSFSKFETSYKNGKGPGLAKKKVVKIYKLAPSDFNLLPHPKNSLLGKGTIANFAYLKENAYKEGILFKVLLLKFFKRYWQYTN